MYKRISFEDAKLLMDTTPDLLILDVREEEEYITGHAVGAVLFTLADINEASAGEVIPSKDTPLMIYCRSGRRSREAGQILGNAVGGSVGKKIGGNVAASLGRSIMGTLFK